MVLLDLGVGGGRTTPYLSDLASSYVGVDYAEEMIRVCRGKYPSLQFEMADAADLSRFADGFFDAIVFSFNGMDYLAPDKSRQQCLRECHRVLKPGGVFIFSSHNPRSLVVGWNWDWNRLRTLTHRITGGRKLLSGLVLGALTCARVGLALLQTLARSIPRASRRIPTRAFWLGEGYLVDPSHGGLLTHCAAPGRVISELLQFRFKFLQKLPEDYPRRSGRLSTRWYYYAFRKGQVGSVQSVPAAKPRMDEGAGARLRHHDRGCPILAFFARVATANAGTTSRLRCAAGQPGASPSIRSIT
jgi:SAM-dependent methyltransferase